MKLFTHNVVRKQTYFLSSIAFLVFGFFSSTLVSAEDSTALQDCESCHIVQASEFEASVHYINRSGVQASCNNCHADQKHENGEKTAKQVSKPRLDMAASEWKRFNANDSKECKECHSSMAMDLAKQEPRSVERHEESFDAGETSCIMCHKAISHYLPAGWKARAKEVDMQK